MSDRTEQERLTSFRLDEIVCQFMDFRGRTPLKLGMEWGGGDIRALSANNVQMGRVDFDKESYFGSEALYRRWMTKGDCRKGDVLLTTEAPLGNVAQVPDDSKYILSQRTILLKAAPAKANPDYLFQLFRSEPFQAALIANSTGTTVVGIQVSKLAKVKVAIPSMPVQRKIARILTTVDNLIEKTEALIAKYQAIKQGMMHDMFTRGVNAHGHLRPPYEEAPELYKQSELGWIPKGWDSGTLGSVCRWMSGGTPSKSNPAFWSGGVPWFSPKDMKSFELIDSEDHISEEASQCGTRLIDPGTVLIVIRGMILAHSFPVGITTRTATFNQDVKALTCDGPVIGRFLAYWLAAHAQEMVNLATESTHGTKRFDMDDLYSVALGVPNKEEQSRIVKLLDTLDTNHRAEQARLGKLLQTKTGLMQDLLTGRVRVTGDEAQEITANGQTKVRSKTA